MVKNLPAGDAKRWGLDLWVRKIPWSRKWQPTLVVLPGKFHGQRSLVGLQSKGVAKRAHTHTRTIKIKGRVRGYGVLFSFNFLL